MLRNFDTVLDTGGTVRMTTRVPAVTEQVVITPAAESYLVPASESRLDLLQEPEAIGWDGMRDYVIGEIERLFGPFPRDPLKEKGIFSSFVNRWGDEAMPIARAAFETFSGYWKNSPIAVNRFCIN
jgi:hypothetical protein